MHFGLINAGATYQRMVNKMFEGKTCVTMEAYVDDMLVKSIKGINHIEDLRKTFERVRFHDQVLLDPAKCTFGVQSGNFLSYIASQRRIEVNPEKLNVVEAMKRQTFHKEV